MGYYTFHEFAIEGNDPSGLTEEDHKTAINILSKYGIELFEDPVKWYDEEENMREYSQLYPTTIFVIAGKGEEQPDIWNAYYLNGKRQELRPEQVWPDFDINNFKD